MYVTVIMVERYCDVFLHLRSKQKLMDIKEQSLGQVWQNSNYIEHRQLDHILCSDVSRYATITMSVAMVPAPYSRCMYM